jgi:hypothetical protein
MQIKMNPIAANISEMAIELIDSPRVALQGLEEGS